MNKFFLQHFCNSMNVFSVTFVQVYTVKMNMLYLINKIDCGNRLQAILLIKLNKLELSNN